MTDSYHFDDESNDNQPEYPDIEDILHGASSPQTVAAIKFGLMTGLRPSALSRLNLDDVTETWGDHE